MFFNSKRVTTDYQQIIDPKIRRLLFETYNLESFINCRPPILMSSINNWVLSKMVDTKLFAGLQEEVPSDIVRLQLEQLMNGLEFYEVSSESISDY